MKLIVDLIYQGGLNYMRYSISDTAEWGDYIAGPQIVNAETRRTMKELLRKIQNGDMAKEWIAENEAGRPKFTEMRRREQHLLVEQVGERLRALMPFLNPVKVPVEPPSAAVGAKP
jgi:ketol-acid reductoisomerase